MLEGGHRIFIVCRHEHYVSFPARALRHLESRHAGHLNVQKHNVRGVLFQLLQRFGAIGCNRADGKHGLHSIADRGSEVELGPQCNETFAKLLAKVSLVLRN